MINNDAFVSKREWQNYCSQLKQINTELSKLATIQHTDIQSILLILDLPWHVWVLYSLGIRKDVKTLLAKYRDPKTNEDKTKSTEVQKA